MTNTINGLRTKNKNMTAEESFPRLKRIMTHTGKFELQKLQEYKNVIRILNYGHI